MPEPVVERRQQLCGHLMAILDECRSKGYLNTAMGSCDIEADALNKCLRAERMDRANTSFMKSKERRKKLEKAWKDLEEEEYGVGGYLREVERLERENKQ